MGWAGHDRRQQALDAILARVAGSERYRLRATDHPEIIGVFDGVDDLLNEAESRWLVLTELAQEEPATAPVPPPALMRILVTAGRIPPQHRVEAPLPAQRAAVAATAKDLDGIH
ncbi:hypothetical protein D5S17_31440 [Pseudonocardiaceae bacterium YIM PH 21723]|nr:hypothetical protein D5S17_31440 [Pseudonocardiaceae bacterium YIM PH 21723]